MINNLVTYLTSENIYLLANWGVIPFWLMLLTIPNQPITKVLVNSVIVPLILASAYVYSAYKLYLDGEVCDVFQLYFGLDSLYSIYSNEIFLLIFWLHFLSISLFIGSWISTLIIAPISIILTRRASSDKGFINFDFTLSILKNLINPLKRFNKNE